MRPRLPDVQSLFSAIARDAHWKSRATKFDYKRQSLASVQRVEAGSEESILLSLGLLFFCLLFRSGNSPAVQTSEDLQEAAERAQRKLFLIWISLLHYYS